MKLLCIGRNYADHVAELANEVPSEPVVFIKPDSAILPREQPFFIPDFSSDVHYELEVLLKIKKVGKHIQEKFAGDYYDEIGLGIDFTARDLQDHLKAKGLPWEKAKGFDGSAVIGEWVPKTNYRDLGKLKFSLYKNGEKVQDGDTSLMLWKFDQLVAYVSRFFTLKKGDILFTGTPSGVGRITPNDYLSGILEGKELLTVNIK
jgi:2-keto-4-pentenoate hydratase/2-oxohepta-3-ene-1,7-dioic acid hydratase in catechol pathway